MRTIRQANVSNRDWEIFEILLAEGVFDVRNGTVILNFDSQGTLRIIEKRDKKRVSLTKNTQDL